MSDKSVLGKEVTYKFDKPDQNILQKVENPHKDVNYNIRLSCPEFTSICPVTSQPDFAHLIIDYVPGDSLVESKSLKLYLFSYRNHGAFHGYWYPRGGIPIDIFYQYKELPKDVWLKEHSISDYKPRG